MAAYDLEGLFDVVPLKRTDLLGDALSTIVAYLQGPERAQGDPIQADPDEDESTEVDWWQHYGFYSRPPEGSEALIVRLGAQAFAIASRAVQVAGFGKLGEGDVALYTVGGNVIRLNANGSISVIVPAGKKQIVMRADPKKKSVTVLLGNGTTIQADEAQGITLMAMQGNITLAAPQGNVQVVAKGLINQSPVLKANAIGAAPLAPGSTNPGVFV